MQWEVGKANPNPVMPEAAPLPARTKRKVRPLSGISVIYRAWHFNVRWAGESDNACIDSQLGVTVPDSNDQWPNVMHKQFKIRIAQISLLFQSLHYPGAALLSRRLNVKERLPVSATGVPFRAILYISSCSCSADRVCRLTGERYDG